MKRKTISFALTLCIIIATCSLVFSVVHLYFEMPMSATIPEKGSLQFYVNGTSWANGTEVEWNPNPGSTDVKTLDIYNNGNVALQITLTLSGLPSNWDLTYNKNGTVLNPNNWLNGTMTLTVPSNVLPATYYWDAYVHATKP